MLADYRQMHAETTSLKQYNEQLAAQVKSQQDELNDMTQQLGEIETTSREVLPMMHKMLATLDQFVKLDVPFLLEERTNRVAQLKDMMTRADVSMSEKYRRIVEAYQIEMEYGRTIEAYQGKVGDKTVDFLRAGRVALMYQTLDGKETGYWDADEKKWKRTTSYDDAIEAGLKVAKKQAAPDFVAVPVRAPKEVELMISRRFKPTLLAAVLAALARSRSQLPPRHAGNLDELLEQTRSARQREAQATRSARTKFLAERNKQAALLNEARAELTEQQRAQRSPSAAFDANEKKLTELQAQLDAQPATSAKCSASSARSRTISPPSCTTRIITAQYPRPRRRSSRSSRSRSRCLRCQDLERFWFELQREMTETGSVVKFKTQGRDAEGAPVEARSCASGRSSQSPTASTCNYLPSQKQLAIMARQPGARVRGPQRSGSRTPSDGLRRIGGRSDSRRAALHLRAAPEHDRAHREGRGGRLHHHGRRIRRRRARRCTSCSISRPCAAGCATSSSSRMRRKRTIRWAACSARSRATRRAREGEMPKSSSCESPKPCCAKCRSSSASSPSCGWRWRPARCSA